jgi:hypothetical protein
MKYLIKISPCKGPAAKRSERSLTMALVSLAAVSAIALPAMLAGQAGSADAQVGLINPAGAAFNPATAKAYVVDAGKGVVNISDDSAGATVAVTGPTLPTPKMGR